MRLAREDLAFFSNAHKLTRESWIADRWTLARGLSLRAITPGGDPPDLFLDGRGVEVVEVVEPGRKRGDHYKAKLGAAHSGRTLPRRLTPRRKVIECGHEWVLDGIKRKAEKYDGASSAAWILLVYVNVPYADCLSWADVTTGLEALRPSFASIEVLFEITAGPRAATIWHRHA